MYENLKERRILLERSWQITNQRGIHHMKDDNVVALQRPVQNILSEILKAGAQKLLAQAVEAHYWPTTNHCEQSRVKKQ